MAAHAAGVPRDHPHAPARIVRALECRQRSDPGGRRNAVQSRGALLRDESRVNCKSSKSVCISGSRTTIIQKIVFHTCASFRAARWRSMAALAAARAGSAARRAAPASCGIERPSSPVDQTGPSRFAATQASPCRSRLPRPTAARLRCMARCIRSQQCTVNASASTAPLQALLSADPSHVYKPHI